MPQVWESVDITRHHVSKRLLDFGRSQSLCMNFVEGGFCHVTEEKCFLGLRGAKAKNVEGECDLHGKFDVWLTQGNNLLITDLGFPTDEPKQCFALGVKETVAREIASKKTEQLGTRIFTTERRCVRCGGQFWMSQYRDKAGLLETGHANFCPTCREFGIDEETEKRLGAQKYWCG